MMPAAGGMAGASISQPQDLLSAINGNPATVTQFGGTQFSFGGGWAEATYNITQLDPLPLVGVDPYSAKSGTPGALVGNIGVIHNLAIMGRPVTAGIGFISNAGAGVDFRDVPESNGTSAHYVALDLVAANGIQFTERLSLGSALIVGSSFIDGPFVDIGGMVPDYALRGTIGANYEIGYGSSFGIYWQSRKSFTFDDAAFAPNGSVFDLSFDHPANLGLGFANHSLMGGRLLLATDVLFKQHSDADFLRAIYDDQWVFQLGTQYLVNPRLRLRMGYGYNENPMRDAVLTSIGGFPLADGVPGLRYVQGQFASICQHRLTGGIGIRDVMPGMDMDLFVGGTFEDSDEFASTIASVEGYWLGYALTWRFGCDDPCDECCER
jgi:long-chain fatty acid transport protein